ncbi:MAG TPA: ATP-binding protein [Acidimicrobiales bacterium]|nr:ATP-binding protein [Acidimicrobiales bacterium]
MTARLYVMCGLPGAGKTTRAKELAAEHNAVRMTPDDILADLWDQEARASLEAAMWDEAQALLAAGTNVVIDFGSWARAERDVLREGARRIGVEVELCYLDLPLDELVRRVEYRNREGISRAHLEEWQHVIEIPTEQELSLFDNPPPP